VANRRNCAVQQKVRKLRIQNRIPVVGASTADNPKTFFPGARRPEPIHSLKTPPIKQDSLIFVGCIDFVPRDGEIDHPVTRDRVAGFEEQLAPRNNAKAPRVHDASSWAP
jgi:hypothetical protein